MTTVRLEEDAPIASPSGWHMRVRINQIEATPGGSERVLRSESYRFKQGAPNETDSQRELRLGVKRNAKQRAMDKFDEAKMAKKRAKRGSKRGTAAAPLPSPAAAWSPAVPPVAAVALGWPGLLPAFGSPELLTTSDVATQRDLAILRGVKRQASPAEVLDGLRSSGLDDDEPWTAQRVIERHDFLRRSVRTTARLVGPAAGTDRMHELLPQCM